MGILLDLEESIRLETAESWCNMVGNQRSGLTSFSELVKKPAALPDNGVGRCSPLAYLSDRSLGFAPPAWLSVCSLRSFFTTSQCCWPQAAQNHVYQHNSDQLHKRPISKQHAMATLGPTGCLRPSSLSPQSLNFAPLMCVRSTARTEMAPTSAKPERPDARRAETQKIRRDRRSRETRGPAGPRSLPCENQ